MLSARRKGEMDAALRKRRPDMTPEQRAEAVAEIEKLGGAGESRYGEAAEVLDLLVHNQSFIPFLTLPAYALLD